MTLIIAIIAGIGLAAATGFRVFLPIFVMALGHKFLNFPISNELGWLSSPAALTVLGSATVLEVGAYYIPIVDNFLDAIATPLALGAGTLVAAASFAGINDEAIKWTLALIAGGGAAGLVQAGTVVTRAVSTGTTGGVANSAVSTGELIGASTLSIMAVVAPVFIVAAFIVLAWLFYKVFVKFKSNFA